MMELSILQHPKDNHPRTVSIGTVVDMIREGRWPLGYPPILLVQGVFEGGTKQADIIRMSGLAVACFPPRDGSNLTQLRQAARDDPHTLLMFGSGDLGLTIIYAYEIDKTYDVESQRKFYQKVLLYGNDYYEAQLEAPPLRKGKDVGKRCTLCHDPDAYFNPNADWFFAMEILEATRPRSGKLKSAEGLPQLSGRLCHARRGGGLYEAEHRTEKERDHLATGVPLAGQGAARRRWPVAEFRGQGSQRPVAHDGEDEAHEVRLCEAHRGVELLEGVPSVPGLSR